MIEEISKVLYEGQPGVVDQVVDSLDKGNVVVLPCDTIYGFCARVGKSQADKLCELKERAQDKLFLRLCTLSQAKEIAYVPSDVAESWPAPFTAILNRRDGEGTVAIRVPDNPFIQKVLEKLDSPIYSTSVNQSGFSSLTNIQDIIFAFKEKVPLFVIGELTQGTTPSTLLNCTHTPYTIIRNGRYDASALIKG